MGAIYLRFSNLKNIFHLPHGKYLVVSTEAKNIMKTVSKIRSHIGGYKSRPLDLVEIHVPQGKDGMREVLKVLNDYGVGIKCYSTPVIYPVPG